MASEKQVWEFILASALSLWLLASQSCAVASPDCDPVAGPVSMALYYEALCSFCANFIVNDLAKAFDSDLISIVDLRLVPWGNSIITPNHNLACQHGPDECMLDAVEACAINGWPDVGTHYSIIQCLERLDLNGQQAQWRSCFTSMSIDPTKIYNCYDNGLAAQLELGYAEETARLNPPHKYVPWVVVDNQALQGDYENFISYVCQAYRGCDMPSACESAALVNHDSSLSAAKNPAMVSYPHAALNMTSLATAKAQYGSVKLPKPLK